MARLRATASAARSVLDGREHGGTLGRVGEPIHRDPTIKKRTQTAIKNRDHAHYLADIAQLPDGTYYVSLTATTVDDEEPQLLSMEIDSRRGVSLDEVLAVIKNGLTSSC